MAKFCGKCGTALNEEGQCPKCDLMTQEAAENEGNVPSKKEIKTRKKVEKAKAKVKKKADKKIAKVEEKAKQKAEGKSEDEVSKIESKASKKIDQITNKYEKKAQKVEQKVLKKEARSFGKKIGIFLLKVILILLGLGIVISTTVGSLVYYGVVDIPVVSEIMDYMGIKNWSNISLDLNEYIDYSNDNRVSSEDRMDASEYYEEYSKVIEKVKIDHNMGMKTEQEAFQIFEKYHLSHCIIVTDYNENGEYVGPKAIQPYSSMVHPVYRSSLVDDLGNVYEVYLVHDVIMVNPVTYNDKSDDDVDIVFSDVGFLKSYDCETKTFYDTEPRDCLIKVESLKDFDTLIETIENMDHEGVAQ